MAIPTAPTASRITTEALKIYGISNPTATEITRATDYGLEWIKDEIWRISHKWEPLKNAYYHVVNEGKSKYGNPTDFDSHESLVLMDGVHADTLSAVTSTSNVTLKASEDAAQDDVEGHLLVITSGTGINQGVQVDDYSATTKVAAMAEAYSTLPVTGDGYLVVDYEKPLTEAPLKQRDSQARFHDKSEPNFYSPVATSTYGGFELFPVPGNPTSQWVIQQRYFASLQRVDLAGTLYTSLLRRWQWVLVQGVFVWKLGQSDDTRYAMELQKLNKMLAELRNRDAADQDMSNLQITVSE